MFRVTDRDIPRRTIPALLLLGFASGLPSELVAGTLQQWFVDVGLKPGEIGLMGLVGLPFALKFLWAPVLDRFAPPFGLRRGWMLLSQVLVLLGLVAMAFLDPGRTPSALLIVATLVAVMSATQDIAVNAITCEAVDERRLGAAAGAAVWGYRAAALVSGAAALALAQHCGWKITYLSLAGMMLIGVAGSLLVPEPVRLRPPGTLAAAVVEPLVAFWRDLGPWRLAGLLAFSLLFRLSDQWAGNQSGVFLRELGFDKEAIGWARGVVGLVAAGVGVAAAGWLATRWGLIRCLWLGGILGAASNAVYLLLAGGYWHGPWGLGTAMAIENACGGFLAAVFVGFLMRHCSPGQAATQYAVLTAAWALGKYLTAPAGYLVASVGWNGFFVASIAVCLPGFVLLELLGRQQRPTT